MKGIKILDIKTVEDDKIKAYVTIELPSLVKISSIKLIRSPEGDYYCLTPSISYIENGVKKWVSVVVFEKPVWQKIQKEIIAEYLKLKKEAKNAS